MQEQDERDRTEKVIFKSGASGSKVPRLDYLPHHALHRIAKRFEIGVEIHGERAWGPDRNDHFLTDRDWAIARAVHVIEHGYSLIHKLRTGKPLMTGDDDAAAIGWGGMCLCEATRALDAEAENKTASAQDLSPGVLRMATELQEARDTWNRLYRIGDTLNLQLNLQEVGRFTLTSGAYFVDSKVVVQAVSSDHQRHVLLTVSPSPESPLVRVSGLRHIVPAVRTGVHG